MPYGSFQNSSAHGHFWSPDKTLSDVRALINTAISDQRYASLRCCKEVVAIGADDAIGYKDAAWGNCRLVKQRRVLPRPTTHEPARLRSCQPVKPLLADWNAGRVDTTPGLTRLIENAMEARRYRS